jgi:Fumarylacetoacetase N-terminal
VLADAGVFEDSFDARAAFNAASLNSFMAMGKAAWNSARLTLQACLSKDQAQSLSSKPELLARCLHEAAAVTMHLPAQIGDYTVSADMHTYVQDFTASCLTDSLLVATLCDCNGSVAISSASQSSSKNPTAKYKSATTIHRAVLLMMIQQK